MGHGRSLDSTLNTMLLKGFKQGWDVMSYGLKKIAVCYMENRLYKYRSKKVDGEDTRVT